MSKTTIAIAPDSARKFINPPLPRWKKPSPRAEKIPRCALVVDEEPLIRWSVSETLSGLGIEVAQAGDAAGALQLITTAAAPFDVVLLDLRLPDMRDLSLLGTIRQLLPDASVVLMTAFGTDEILERAIALGAETVLNKPFELGALVDAVYGVTP